MTFLIIIMVLPFHNCTQFGSCFFVRIVALCSRGRWRKRDELVRFREREICGNVSSLLLGGHIGYNYTDQVMSDTVEMCDCLWIIRPGVQNLCHIVYESVGERVSVRVRQDGRDGV